VDHVSAAAPSAHAIGAPAKADTKPASSAGVVMALVVVIWGLGPPVTKLITAPPLVSVSVRFWISLPLIWVLAYATGRRVSWHVLRKTALAGALFGVNLAFVFSALHRTRRSRCSR
jgi:drug/metabolite transporter (DMT)-like permease